MALRALALLVSILLLAGCGITGNFRHDAGYADFGSFQGLAADSDFGISLGPLPLKVANMFVEDEEIGPLLRELRAVRVYVFEGISDVEALAPRLEKVGAELAVDGWLNVAAVREGAELTSVFLRPDKNFTHRGLAVIVVEANEVVLVNLIGNIRLDFIDGYMAELDVDIAPIEIDAAALQAALITRPADPAAETGP